MTDDERMATVSLKEYFDTRFADSEKRHEVKYGFQDKALSLAKAELEQRLEGMNQFRKQLEKQEATFVTRDRADTEHQILTEKINTLNLWKAAQEGKQARSNLISIAAMVISAIFALVHMIQSFGIKP